MKKILLALATVAMFAACGGNSNNTENDEDTTTYEQVKQQIDSTVAENAPEIIQEEWQDGGEIVWDN
ncbi:MAG: hypothetical protein IJQ89_01910 [Bacteroidales bacterium]|nr:hypothetical protein [Bacteroidales bacterium]